MLSISDCKLVELPKISEPRGNLTFVEGLNHIPFDIKRVFYVYDIPTGEARGAHAHRTLEEVVICMSGSLDVVVNDGKESLTIHLNRPFRGLYIPPLIWSNMQNFDSNTIYLVLSSCKYEESDYIRDFDSFLRIVNGGGK